MRNWLINALGGPIGFIVKGVIAAIVGALVGIGYDEAWKYIYHIPAALFVAQKIMASMDPAVLAALTPTAIGTAAGGAAWAGLQSWFIGHLKAGNKVAQQILRDSPSAPNVNVDGIITKDGETVQSLKILSRAAYEKVYPDDTANRGGDEMPETRKPLP